MKKFIKTLLFIGILLTFTHESASINVECKFEDGAYYGVGKAYGCVVKNKLDITSPDNATITSVTGMHQEGRTNNDVEAFICWEGNIKYFPKGFDVIFPNLKVFYVNDDGIKEIHQSDLKQFPNLEYLNLRNNRIEVIEENLFQFHRNLKFIALDKNPITYIHPNVFDDLDELSYFWLHSLPCVDKGVYGNLKGVKKAIQVVKSKCNNHSKSDDSLDSSESKQQLVELDKNSKASDYSNSSTFQKLTEKLHEIAKEYEAGPTQNEAQIADIQIEMKKMTTLTTQNQAQIADIQIELKKLAILTTQNQAQIANIQLELKEILKIILKLLLNGDKKGQ